ncbi:MAG TPA: mechanosensitive ion channel family protein [Arcobacter sp.]|nr:mechanosensitive ion channel family protein [Arcobacter sp.]
MILDKSLEEISIAIGIFLIFLVLRKLFTSIILKSAKVFVQKSKTQIDDKILEVLSKPITFSFIVIGIYLSLAYLNYGSLFFDKSIKSLIIFVIFWIVYDLVKVFNYAVSNFTKKFGSELHKEIASFLVKTIKIFIALVGGVAILQVWDINVSAFIASLGLGGLAFALAAKDTAANLFGGLTILADKALKMGDWIKVGSVEGVVEDIGLRTTKIRTFEKSLITLPNQILANQPVENFSRRGIRRIKFRVGLTYDTSSVNIQKIVEEIRIMLQSHSKIAQDATMLVRFDRFEDSSLSIFIYTFTSTSNWGEYLEIKEDVNLKVIKIVEEHNSAFAFPSQSIYIEKGNSNV